MSEYEPEFLEGIIIVYYKSRVLDLPGEPPAVVGGILGYELTKPPYEDIGDEVFHKTPVGEEDKAIAAFLTEDRFVEGAERVDKKFYETWDQLEEGVDKAERLRDDYPISDDIFNAGIDSLIQYYET